MKKKFLAVAIAVLAASSLASSAQASTMGQREALDSARSYLRWGHFSRAGLIDQLESPYGEDFSHSEAVWGVNHAHANWYAEAVEAVEAAKSYLRSGHFSRRGLIDQLESPYGEHFTHAQAVYGVSKAYR
jgi:Host cell surface-exposed lipoprotein